MELCSKVTDLVEFLRAEAQVITPPAVSLIVFGSTARGCARADSDVDVLAVRPAGVEFDDDEWTDSLDSWRCSAQAIVGRSVEIIEAGQDEVPTLLARPGPTVWRAIAQEGVVIAGRPLHELAEAILAR